METNETNKYFLPIAVIVAGLFIGGAVIWNGSHPSVPNGAAVAGVAGALAVDVKNVNIEGSPFIGQENAPVTIAFWSDFQCPYCKAVEIGDAPRIPNPPVIPDIIKNYVDSGKVKIVFMDFVFLGNDSITASLYSQAVWKLYPDKYFEWRNAVLEAQVVEGDQGFGDTESIDKLNATISGIDATKVAEDVRANMSTYQAKMDADKTEAGKVGIKATPSFVIGTQMIEGAYPYTAFQTAIDEELLK
ncbi:MAG: thioredoxin domain-containing protein [Candidatus Paceibacterota bacterium]|jgi:protein-disulfide isomerase